MDMIEPILDPVEATSSQPTEPLDDLNLVDGGMESETTLDAQ